MNGFTLKSVARACIPLDHVKVAVVLGDVHGDVCTMHAVLERLGVVDEAGAWIAPPTTVLVQLGDTIDDAPRTGSGAPAGERGGAASHFPDWSVLQYLDRLRQSAPHHHNVCTIVGNHEMMVVGGDTRYASATSVRESPGASREGRIAMFRPGGAMATMLARHGLVVLQIGGVLFTHAGLTPNAATAYDGDIGRINAAARAYLLGDASIAASTADIAHLLHGDDSVMFNRRLIDDAYLQSNAVGETLRAFGARAMVVGHNVVDRPTTSPCGRVVFLDTGLSIPAFGEAGGRASAMIWRPPSPGTGDAMGACNMVSWARRWGDGAHRHVVLYDEEVSLPVRIGRGGGG